MVAQSAHECSHVNTYYSHIYSYTHKYTYENLTFGNLKHNQAVYTRIYAAHIAIHISVCKFDTCEKYLSYAIRSSLSTL